MFQAAVEGLLHRDSDLCTQIVADDDEIDVLEKKVDLDGINLRFQPGASDMRG
jgi:phosphate transport system protein